MIEVIATDSARKVTRSKHSYSELKPQNMNEWGDISFGITVISLRKDRMISKKGWLLHSLTALGFFFQQWKKNRCKSIKFIHYLRINKDKAVRF